MMLGRYFFIVIKMATTLIFYVIVPDYIKVLRNTIKKQTNINKIY